MILCLIVTDSNLVYLIDLINTGSYLFFYIATYAMTINPYMIA